MPLQDSAQHPTPRSAPDHLFIIENLSTRAWLAETLELRGRNPGAKCRRRGLAQASVPPPCSGWAMLGFWAPWEIKTPTYVCTHPHGPISSVPPQPRPAGTRPELSPSQPPSKASPGHEVSPQTQTHPAPSPPSSNSKSRSAGCGSGSWLLEVAALLPGQGVLS